MLKTTVRPAASRFRTEESPVAWPVFSSLVFLAGFDLGGTAISHAVLQLLRQLPHDMGDVVFAGVAFFWASGFVCGLFALSLFEITRHRQSTFWRFMLGFSGGGSLMSLITLGSIFAHPSGAPQAWFIAVSLAFFCAGPLAGVLATKLPSTVRKSS
jgi:hypothetical protein